LCHKKYWEESLQSQPLFEQGDLSTPQIIEISQATKTLTRVFGK